jgi:hypothetical protein
VCLHVLYGLLLLLLCHWLVGVSAVFGVHQPPQQLDP